jgi:hypothetical protein
MYSGAATVEIPTPNPPKNRAALNEYTPVARADQTADTRYSTPTPSRVARRPNRSVGHPPAIAPRTVPYRAEPMANPC